MQEAHKHSVFRRKKATGAVRNNIVPAGSSDTIYNGIEESS
ncbi:hypothetical protein D1BOALGB6SA_1798 [Olavius sp. associated proteobacterium Delta 1]|nr:hypothetical protein D1BOALGB6SA_1798 [Olavius sp. associated proteobacterium Delta 1]